jgi:hypothetical protein
MKPICVIREAGRTFIKGGTWTGICVPRTCQFIAARWPGPIDPCVGIFLKGWHHISWKGGQVADGFVSIRVYRRRARLP